MLHPEFATEKSTDYLNRSLPTLEEALKQGAIRNAVLTDLKFYLSRAYDYERDRFRDIASRGVADDELVRKDIWAAADTVPYSMAHLGTVARKVAAVTKKRQTDDPKVDAALHLALRFHDRWAPVLSKLEAAKPLAVKGRASAPERKTPVRTLDNTGTCCICERNVKLKNGDIVDHGFEVSWGSRNGNCFGVGYQPLEVSPRALHDFMGILNEQRATTLKQIERIQKDEVDVYHVQVGKELHKIGRDHKDFAFRRNRALDDAQGDLRNLDWTIKRINKKIAEWSPRPLPGQPDHDEADLQTPGP